MHMRDERATDAAPLPEMAVGDEREEHRLPLGSLAGLLGAALVAVVLLLRQEGDDPPALTETRSLATGAVPRGFGAVVPSATPQLPTARVFYFVTDVEQAQELAAAFTGGATVGEILLAGTTAEEARAWEIIGNRQASLAELSAHPARVIDLRPPGAPQGDAP